MVRKVGDYGDVAVFLREEKSKFSSSVGFLTLDSIVDSAMQMSSFNGDDSV